MSGAIRIVLTCWVAALPFVVATGAALLHDVATRPIGAGW